MNRFNKYIFLFTICSCTLLKSAEQLQTTSPYFTFLEEKKTKRTISNILLSSTGLGSDTISANKIIVLCNQLTLNSNQLFKHRTLSYVYADIGDTINEMNHITKAVLLGHYPMGFSGYEKARNEYLKRIDTSTVRLLKYIDSIDQNARTPNHNSKTDYYKNMAYVDSLTLHLMDSLIKTNNGEWLGFDKIGKNGFGINQNVFSHDIAVHHMEEEDNHRYFNLILKACKAGNEDWSCAEGIKWQQLRRFVGQPYTSYDYMKLRRLKFNNNLFDLEDDETLMTINEVSKLIRNYSQYGKKAIIYPTVLIKDKGYLLLCKSLMNELSKFDIEEEATFDSSILMPMDSLEKIGNDYPFVVKIVDK